MVEAMIALTITFGFTLWGYRFGLRRALAVIEQDDDVEDGYSVAEILGAIHEVGGNEALALARQVAALLRGDEDEDTGGR